MIKRRIKKAENAKYQSVWDALEDAREEKESMKVRSVLMRAIHGKIIKDKVSQARAAVLLKVSQPRVSDLMRGKIDLFSTDALINMAALLGLHVHVKVKAAT